MTDPTRTEPELAPLSDEQLDFAMRNMRSSTTSLGGAARCNWCDRPAEFKSKLESPKGTFFNCRHHFAGLGVEGNPSR